MAYQYGFCFGIVKGKMPKNATIFTATDYDAAIRKVKTYAKSNYKTNHKEATLFHNGVVMGWTFRSGGEDKIAYLDKWELQSAGIIPKPRRK